MAGHRPVRVLMSTLLTTLMLIVAPLAHGDHALAAGNPTSTQTLTMTVPLTGILTVSTVSSTVSWNYPDSADLGQLSFINNLNDSISWNVTAAMTDLVPTTAPSTCVLGSTNCLSFANMALTTSTIFASTTGGSITDMVRGASGSFSGSSDDTPGITLSTPKATLTAPGGDKGSYTQGDGSSNDNTITPAAGLSLEPGSYSGTLQYTITG